MCQSILPKNAWAAASASSATLPIRPEFVATAPAELAAVAP